MTPTTADLLLRGMGWVPLDTPPQTCPAPQHCALTGAPITQGYPVMEIIPASTGNYLDLLPGGVAGWLSEPAAICYSNDFRIGARLIFEDGAMFYPLIDAAAAAAATPPRPCWRDLVRDELPERLGQRHICFLNTDYKKRVWTKAPVCTVGASMRWYVYDTSRGVAGVQTVALSLLRATLALVEEVYAAYPKPRIERGLWDARRPAGVSWAQMRQWERALHASRPTPEFAVSILIAQKESAA